LDYTSLNIPRGFTLNVLENEQFEVRHKGVLGQSKYVFLFLGLWLLLWTFACVALLFAYLEGQTMDDGSAMPLWFLLAFWIPEFIVLGVMIFMIQRKYYFRFDDGMLYAESRRFLLGNDVELRRSAIGKVTLESGKVIVQADTVPYILFKNSSGKKCLWLGELIAKWARVEIDE